MFLKKLKEFFSVKEEPKKKPTKTGVIKFFNYKKGYGFIRSQQTLKDVFVHVKDAKDRIYKGAKVEFQVEATEKGLMAKNVVLA